MRVIVNGRTVNAFDKGDGTVSIQDAKTGGWAGSVSTSSINFIGDDEQVTLTDDLGRYSHISMDAAIDRLRKAETVTLTGFLHLEDGVMQTGEHDHLGIPRKVTSVIGASVEFDDDTWSMFTRTDTVKEDGDTGELVFTGVNNGGPIWEERYTVVLKQPAWKPEMPLSMQGAKYAALPVEERVRIFNDATLTEKQIGEFVRQEQYLYAPADTDMVMAAVVRHPNAGWDALANAIRQDDMETRILALRHQNMTPDLVESLAMRLHRETAVSLEGLDRTAFDFQAGRSYHGIVKSEEDRVGAFSADIVEAVEDLQVKHDLLKETVRRFDEAGGYPEQKDREWKSIRDWMTFTEEAVPKSVTFSGRGVTVAAVKAYNPDVMPALLERSARIGALLDTGR